MSYISPWNSAESLNAASVFPGIHAVSPRGPSRNCSALIVDYYYIGSMQVPQKCRSSGHVRRSKSSVKGHRNLIIARVHHDTYSYQDTSISDQEFFSFCVDRQTDKQTRPDGQTPLKQCLLRPHHRQFSYSNSLTLSIPAVPNCCCLKGSAPYRSNPSFLFLTFGRSGAQS